MELNVGRQRPEVDVGKLDSLATSNRRLMVDLGVVTDVRGGIANLLWVRASAERPPV